MVDRFSRAKSIGDQIDQLGLDPDKTQKVKSIHDVQQQLAMDSRILGGYQLFCFAWRVSWQYG